MDGILLDKALDEWCQVLPTPLTLEQAYNWVGSGKVVVTRGPQGYYRVPCEEVVRVKGLLALAVAHRAHRPGTWLTLEYRDGQPLADPLWPTPLFAAFLTSDNLPAAKRRADRLISSREVPGQRIGYEHFTPRSQVVGFFRRNPEALARHVLSSLGSYGVTLDLGDGDPGGPTPL